MYSEEQKTLDFITNNFVLYNKDIEHLQSLYQTSYDMLLSFSNDDGAIKSDLISLVTYRKLSQFNARCLLNIHVKSNK